MANSVTASLQFLGAAGGVTGSKYLFSYGDEQLLIDCGLFQGLKELRQRNWAPVPIDPTRLNAVILTHAHIDHSGYLPRIVSKGFNGGVCHAGNLRSSTGDAAGRGALAGRRSALRESEGLLQALAGVGALHGRGRRTFITTFAAHAGSRID